MFLERYGRDESLPRLRPCPEQGCKRAFSSEDTLRQHIDIAHGQLNVHSDPGRPPYACPEPSCGSWWFTLGDLQQHGLEEHADDFDYVDRCRYPKGEVSDLEQDTELAQYSRYSEIIGTSEAGTGQKQADRVGMLVPHAPENTTETGNDEFSEIKEKTRAGFGNGSMRDSDFALLKPDSDSQAVSHGDILLTTASERLVKPYPLPIP